jgi:YD repeat-containing protein
LSCLVTHETYTFAMEYEYDSWNRIKQMTYPDGEVVTYGYDVGGQLVSVEGYKDGTPFRIVDNILYDKFGSRAFIAYGNDTETEYAYDPYRRRLAALQTVDGAQTPFMDLSYSYDNENNITGIANNAGAVNGLGGGYEYIYRYDDMYRLTSANGEFTDNKSNIFRLRWP